MGYYLKGGKGYGLDETRIGTDEFQEEVVILQGDWNIVSTTNIRGAVGGYPTHNGGLNIKFPDQGFNIYCYPPIIGLIFETIKLERG